MSPKSELFSVRIEEELSERITKIVENRRESTPEYEEPPGEPQVHRELLRAGVEDHEQGESDVSKLNKQVHELEAENEQLREQLNTPLRERLSRSLLAVLGGSASIVFIILLIVAALVFEWITGQALPPEFDTLVGYAIFLILLILFVVVVSGSIVVGRQLRQSLAGNV